jgi:phage gp16-like protein
MPQQATKARPATFDAANQERRSLIAKIHVAKKEMSLLDDDYRQMLLDTTGRASSADCTVAELRGMVEAMKAKGFQPKPRAPASGGGSAKPATHPFAAKARALWISLYHLNAIDNPSEQAFEAFARRQLKCERMQWANQAQAYKLIEALKAIADRHGWQQRIDWRSGLKVGPADVALRILKVRLIERIAHLLGERRIVPVEMPLGRIAWTLAGMERDGPVGLWNLGDLDLLAKALGEKLREAGR